MTKIRATLIHLCISAAVVLFVVGLMVFVWYPPPLFSILGGYGLLVLIAGIDAILGPALTFLIFKPGKKMLKLDLSVIGVLQTAALLYGIYTIAEVRPAFVVFVKDRFELVRAFDIKAEHYAEAKSAEFMSAPWTGPKYIGVAFPKAAKEQLELMNSSLDGGADIHLLPKYFDDLNFSRSEIGKKAQSLDVLIKLNPVEIDHINKLPDKFKLSRSDIGFVVLRAIRADVAVIVDSRSGEILETLMLKPW